MNTVNIKRFLVFSSLIALGSVSPYSVHAMMEEELPENINKGIPEELPEIIDDYVPSHEKGDGERKIDLEEKDVPKSTLDPEPHIMFLLEKIHTAFSKSDVLSTDSHGLAKLSNLSALTNNCKSNDITNKDLRNNIRNVFLKAKTAISLIKSDIEVLKNLKTAITAPKPLCLKGGWSRGDFPESFKKNEIINSLDEIISAQEMFPDTLTVTNLLTLNDLPLLSDKKLKEVATYGAINKMMLASILKIESMTRKGSPLPYISPYKGLESMQNGLNELRVKATKESLDETDLFNIIKHLGHLEDAISKYNPSVHAPSAHDLKLTEQYIKDTLTMIRETRGIALNLAFPPSTKERKIVIRFLQQKNTANFNKIAELLAKEEIWVLSLDGGGIKGVLGATVLDHISKTVGQPIPALFDFFAGTSTGGLIALGLTTPSKENILKPAFNTEFVKNLYLKYGETIFPPMSGIYKTFFQAWSNAYPPDNLESLLASFFGNQVLSDAVKPTLITTVNITHGAPMFFASYKPYSAKLSESLKININPDKNIRIATAARATSAAPSYFPPITTYYNGASRELIDGGVTTNNPTLLALQEIFALKKQYPFLPFNIKKINVVSIGTGVPKYHHEFGRSGVGLLKVLEAFTHIGMGFSVSETDIQVENFLNLLHTTGQLKNGFTYYRFNPDVGDVELDSASVENIEKLTKISEGIIRSNQFAKFFKHLTSGKKLLEENTTTRLLGNVRDPKNATRDELEDDLLKSGDLGDLSLERKSPNIFGEDIKIPTKSLKPKRKKKILIEPSQKTELDLSPKVMPSSELPPVIEEKKKDDDF